MTPSEACAPEDIVVFHVGGTGGYGPIDALLETFPGRCVVYVFEARSSEADVKTQEAYTKRGVRTVLVNACIADQVGSARLYVNRHEASSSMLPPSPGALGEHIPGLSGANTWQENTELEREVILPTISLGHFVQEESVVPDVLSVDAQGMEYRILKGLGSSLGSVNLVVSEVEFFEVYAGQALFDEQFALLREAGFRLAHLYNMQDWHPGPICGAGFLTVAEALWVREISSYMGSNEASTSFLLQGVKLAAVAFAFRRYSYAYALLKELKTRDEQGVVALCRRCGFEVLLDLLGEMDGRMHRYCADNQIFTRYGVGVERSSLPGLRFIGAWVDRLLWNRFWARLGLGWVRCRP